LSAAHNVKKILPESLQDLKICVLGVSRTRLAGLLRNLQRTPTSL
jgi:hypothetical protein